MAGEWEVSFTTTGMNMTINSWQHVTASWSTAGTSFSVTVDGATETNDAGIGGGIIQPDQIIIGSGGGGPFVGYIDEIEIYNEVVAQ